MPPNLPDAPSRRLDRAVSLLVLLAACAMAARLYAGYWEHSREAWWWPQHDRHAHYSHGLNLALDLRALDLVRVGHDLNAPRVWGPLHCLLVAGVQLAAGPDHRLAVLPSLAGWVLTVWLSFLVARRMVIEHGNAAGLAAAAIVASLPAHRAFATDVMLESSGAALSLLALYFYLAAVQDGAARSGAGLALSLLALFFLKYNYWLLVVLGLTSGEFLRRPAAWIGTLREWSRGGLPPLIKREARQPLSWIALLLFSSAILLWNLTPREPHAIFTAAAWALAARLLLWWRSGGRAFTDTLDPRLRPVLVWHGFALTAWFLLPKRLGFFLWFVSPANSAPQFASTTFPERVSFYLRALTEDYSPQWWGVYGLLILIPLAAFLLRQMRPGSGAVLAFFVVAALLTVQHTMTKGRFAHSWAAAGWILAAGALFTLLRRAPAWSAALAGLAVVALHLPAYDSPGRATEAGRKPECACPLALTDAYLPHVGDARHTTILSNIPARFFFSWTFREAYHQAEVTVGVPRFKERLERDPAALSAWLEGCLSDALVVVEASSQSPLAVNHPESYDLTALAAVLQRQSAFIRERRWELPQGVTVSLWRKGRDQLQSPERERRVGVTPP